MNNLRMYVVTYNVGTSTPDEALHDLLSLSTNPKNDKVLPDVYVICLQEVKAKPTNLLLDALFDDPWTNGFRDILEEYDYVKLKSIRLQGLVTSIYCLRKHLLSIRDLETEYTRTGLSGMWGNKGAVTIRISAYGCSICFVNAHLAPHDEGLDDRIEDYNAIIKDQEFHVGEHTHIFFHDYVFWMGDLNFRLLEEYGKEPEEIVMMIKKGYTHQLFEHDQLRAVMKSGKAFSELCENDPEFAPTFKYEVGSSSDYDFKRRPAWTDRILYRVTPNNYENVTLKVEQKSYKAHNNYKLSDHKPVTAEFVIKIPEITLHDAQVFADNAEHAVQFEKIPIWYVDEENTVVYKMGQQVPRFKDDWIGVFKDKFSSLDDYIVYEYVTKSSSPTASPLHQRIASPSFKYSITFPEIPLNTGAPPIRLIYCSVTEDDVFTVLGVSDPIPIAKKEA